jgi:hypothetical protein
VYEDIRQFLVYEDTRQFLVYEDTCTWYDNNVAMLGDIPTIDLILLI